MSNSLLVKADTTKISIVIAGRNSAAFLKETIESALSQTLPCEVVYVDDASTDSSLEVAASVDHSPGRTFRIIQKGTHTGVEHTRNIGALATKGKYIIFLDSDDILPSNYAVTMLMDANRYPTAPFIYPSVRAFGDDKTFWKNLEWNQYDKWTTNQCSTTSMWLRTAFMAAGMWHKLPTMWDYDLALRCSRFGVPVAGSAILNYRIHSSSVSAQLDERTASSALAYKQIIRRRNATIGIGCVYSNRLPGLFFRWLDNLSLSIRYANVQPRLLILHTEPSTNYQELVEQSSRFSDSFTSIEHVRLHPSFKDMLSASPQEAQQLFHAGPEWTSEIMRRIRVSRLLAYCCQYIQQELDTDLVWLLEDDIHVPIKSCSSLLETVVSGDVPPIGVSGLYLNRHTKTHFLGGCFSGKHEEPRQDDAIPSLMPVDFVGTGCLMYWTKRPASPKTWRPFCKRETSCAHDWAWSEDVQSLGGRLYLLGDTRCRHYISETEFV